MIIGLKKMLPVVNIVHTEHVRVECIVFIITETYFLESNHSSPLPSDDEYCVAALRGTDCTSTCCCMRGRYMCT